MTLLEDWLCQVFPPPQGWFLGSWASPCSDALYSCLNLLLPYLGDKRSSLQRDQMLLHLQALPEAVQVSDMFLVLDQSPECVICPLFVELTELFVHGQTDPAPGSWNGSTSQAVTKGQSLGFA